MRCNALTALIRDSETLLANDTNNKLRELETLLERENEGNTIKVSRAGDRGARKRSLGAISNYSALKEWAQTLRDRRWEYVKDQNRYAYE